MAFESSVTQVADPLGGSGTVYQLRWRDTTGGQIPTFLSRNFGVASASVVEVTYVWACNAVAGRSRLGFGVMRDGAGIGPTVILDGTSGSWALGAGVAGSWAQYGSLNGFTAGLPLSANTYYKMHIKVVPNADGSAKITATVRTLGDVDIGSYETTVNTTLGDYCGAYSTFDQLGGASLAYIRSVQVQASGSTGYTPANLATSYVYTFVNDIGEESAPSPASATILRPDGLTVTVTTPVAVPSGVSSDYNITTKRIYRAATGNTGTQFLFVAEIPLATATYDDTLTDAQLGEVLESTGWDLPPDDLQGILALPNGIMVGFRRNQLCFSAQNRPHAWPPLYRLNTDTDIVGIANVDTTVVIGTESFIYVATGNDPAAYSMSKFEVPYAAVSKRSFAYLTGIGVVFAGTDGLMAVTGVGQARNLTDGVFTLRQWKDLDPTTIRAVQHNDIYWLFARPPEQGGSGTPGQTYKAYALDMKSNGFGVVEMPFHASAAHVDPITDTMYLVLDDINEPDDPLLPIPPSQPSLVTQGDTDYGNVVLLLHGNGSDGSTTFTDSSQYARASTPSGAVEIDTAQFKFGGASIYSPASQSGLVFGSSADFANIGPYTIEFWIRIPNLPAATQYFLSHGSTRYFAINTSGLLAYTNGATCDFGTLTPGQWYHVALVVSGSTPGAALSLTGYLNGTRAFNAVVGALATTTASSFSVNSVPGRLDLPSLNGWLDDVRYTSLIRYTGANITVPTAEFADYVTKSGNKIFAFEGDDTQLMTYRWKGKLWLLPAPSAMMAARVRAEDYDNILLRVYGDGVQVDEIVVTSEEEFTLAETDAYRKVEIEVLGTSTIREIQIAEDVRELT